MKPLSEMLNPYRAYCTERKNTLREEISALEQQNRQDEANLAKIRLNIYEVFETVAAADEKVCPDWASFCARYETRFDTLTAPWKNRLASAVRNSDTRTRFIEETKLATAEHIHKAFVAAKES